MAYDSGLQGKPSEKITDFLEEFAKQVAAHEREACAKLADQPSEATYECIVACGGPEQTFTQSFPKQAHEIAVAIRGRGEA